MFLAPPEEKQCAPRRVSENSKLLLALPIPHRHREAAYTSKVRILQKDAYLSNPPPEISSAGRQLCVWNQTVQVCKTKSPELVPRRSVAQLS
mmetsp:Transcript_15655/g.27817  ORF Transcript_15655/g.27817 Transcript_15655/m.27817 type:complete len:92 (-) Transcript_15655:39-314(-)